MVFNTYILTLKNNTYYTGITNNKTRRLKEHQDGKSKSTKHYRPVKMIYSKEFKTRKEARRLEVKIKNLGAKKYLNRLKFSTGDH